MSKYVPIDEKRFLRDIDKLYKQVGSLESVPEGWKDAFIPLSVISRLAVSKSGRRLRRDGIKSEVEKVLGEYVKDGSMEITYVLKDPMEKVNEMVGILGRFIPEAYVDELETEPAYRPKRK